MHVHKGAIVATFFAVALHGCFFLPEANPIGVSGNRWTKVRWISANLSQQNIKGSIESISQPHLEQSHKAPLESDEFPTSTTAPSIGNTRQSEYLVLASTFVAALEKNAYLGLEEVDTAAVPATNWILPLNKGYLDKLDSIVVNVWIQRNGTIAGVELLEAHPMIMNHDEMQELTDRLASTPMISAFRNGSAVNSKRTVEIAFEH